MAKSWAATAVVCAVLSAGLTISAVQPAAAATIFVDYLKPTPGPRGAVTIMGDSVMLGSTLDVEGYGPSLSLMLQGLGWGPVLAHAGVGFQAGSFTGTNAGASLTQFVLTKRAAGWDSPSWVISIGPNDVLFCKGNVTCAENDILGLVDTIGPGHQIWFSLITAETQVAQDTWNAALHRVAAERPFVYLWDWPTVLANSSIPISADHTHLPTGAAYVQKSALMAVDIGNQLQAHSVGDSETAPLPIGNPSEYQPLPQNRVYDSRKLNPGSPGVAAGSTITVDLSSFVPVDASAVSINLTEVYPTTPGYLTAYPCGGTPPVTSNVNFGSGDIRPNNAVVGLGAGAKLCVFSSSTGDVIVDLQGAFVPSGGLKLDTRAPTRLVDTRVTGRVDPLVVAMPAGAQGAVLNVTAVNAVDAGYLVVYPCDAPVPSTSNLNFVAAAAAAGSTYAQVSAAGTVCVHANVATDVVVDLQGTFSTTGALRFQAASPKRMIDTRFATGGWFGQVVPGETVNFRSTPAGAQAVTGNITMILPGVDGYANAYACGGPAPTTSSVNAARTQTSANSLTTGVTDNGLCVQSSAAAHIIFDTTGWWIP